MAGDHRPASVVGAAIGIYSARAVKMTAMPQMVAIFNGCGGGAAALVAMGELMKLLQASGGTLGSEDARHDRCSPPSSAG